MLRAGTTTFEAKSGYGLDRDTELAQLRVIRSAGGVATWLGAHAVPPEFEADGPAAYVDFLVEEVLPDAARSLRPRTSSSSGAPSASRTRAGTWRPARRTASELRLHGDQFTESGAIPLAVELGARSVDHLESTGRRGIAALAASDVVGVLLPASALFLGRPMPPARGLVDGGAAIALATDFNPGSAFCESLPLVCSLACTQLRLSPAEALAACTVNSAHVLSLADRKGRSRPATTRTSSWSPRTTGGISRTTWAARWSTRSSGAGGSPGAARHNRGMPTRKQRRRRAKELRHEYVWEDDEGNELHPRRSRAGRASHPRSGAPARSGASRNRRPGAAR